MYFHKAVLTDCRQDIQIFSSYRPFYPMYLWQAKDGICLDMSGYIPG